MRERSVKRFWTNIAVITAILLIAVPAVAENPPPGCEALKRDCDLVIGSYQAEVDALRALQAKDAELIQALIKQRNDALRESAGQGLPWWAWALVGGAATTILIRGVK